MIGIMETFKFFMQPLADGNRVHDLWIKGSSVHRCPHYHFRQCSTNCSDGIIFMILWSHGHIDGSMTFSCNNQLQRPLRKAISQRDDRVLKILREV